MVKGGYLTLILFTKLYIALIMILRRKIKIVILTRISYDQHQQAKHKRSTWPTCNRCSWSRQREQRPVASPTSSSSPYRCYALV